MESLKIKEN